MPKKSLTIISWNVNGLRAALKKGFLDFLKTHDPDMLCLQETKAEQHQVEIDLPQYEEYWNSATKKGYAGTAIFTKQKPQSILNDIPKEMYKTPKKLMDNQGRDAGAEGRIITAEYETFYLVTVYTPNTKDNLSRLSFRYTQWDPLFLAYLKHLEKKKPVIVCGDLNVAHTEIDLARPKENEGVHGFTKEEREGFDSFLSAGFIDIFRDTHPGEKGHYTWWSPWSNARARNVGWRIDYFLVSPQLKKRVVNAFILPEVTGSDHCPVGLTLKSE